MSAPAKLIVIVLLAAGAIVVGIFVLPGEQLPGPDAPQQPDAAANENADGPITFTRDVAPIVFEHCANCHRPGESAPFSLLTYHDIKTHAEQIADITSDRIMPPWLPTADHDTFIGSRRLSNAQITLFQRWIDDGELEGDANDLPPLPKSTEGWQLGQPDLVITMPEEYTLRADGTDVFRNFIIPIPVSETKYVRAIELRPGNKRIVHHASMFVDRTRSTRRLDDKDPGPGFDGMEVADAKYPDGHFLGWTPGKTPDAGVEGISWRLEPGSDLVLQLHMVPGGKPEPIRSSIGLFFDKAPRTSIRAYTIILKADEALNIPPGESNFVVGDSFSLPIDTHAILIYPHSHYLGKQIHATAVLPDGTIQSLIKIDDWDFNWQDSYRYTEPVFLPKGTIVGMQWIFDNSAENIRNPSNPPKHVKYGNRSTDEMAHLYLQLMLRSDREEGLLREASFAHQVQKFPGDWSAATQLGRAKESLGKMDEAIAAYQRALQLKSDYPVAHQSLGLALRLKGDFAQAAEHFRQAIKANSDDVRAHFRLADVLQLQGQDATAIAQYRQTLKVDPQFTEAMNNLAWLLSTTPEDVLRQPQEAITLAEQASQLQNDQNPSYLDTLSAAYAAAGQYEKALATAKAALALAKVAKNVPVVREIEEHLQRYERRQPLWESRP